MQVILRNKPSTWLDRFAGINFHTRDRSEIVMPFIPQNALNKSSPSKQQAHVMLSFRSKVGLNSIGSFKRRNVQARLLSAILNNLVLSVFSVFKMAEKKSLANSRILISTYIGDSDRFQMAIGS